MSWSKGYKKSIDCSNPKGFSQKAHCAGRKARQAGKDTKSKSVNEMKISELKEQIRTVLRERSVKAIQKDYSNVVDDIQKHLELYKKSKGTPEEKKHIGHLKSLGEKKKSLQKELDIAVAGLYKNAELKVEESINEATEPEIISQLKDIVKNKQYQSVKDPKSGKKMKVDMQTANAVLQIYNGLSNVNKENMVKMGLPKMIDVSFKIINKYK